MKNHDKKPIPGIEWEITSKCNYRCSYCCQNAYSNLIWKHCSDQEIEQMFKLFRNRSEKWLIKLSGGEPFLHPRFLEICSLIASSNHKLCTTTNFSASLNILEKFINICGTKLDYITASLHLEQTNMIEFLNKAAAFNKMKSKKTDLIVTSVCIDKHYKELLYVSEFCQNEGIKFELNPLKDNGKYVECNEPVIKELLDKQPLTNSLLLSSSSMFGKICHTGEMFARITVEGDVLRCYNIQPIFYLGNIRNSNFKMFSEPLPCTASKCTCTVPVNRNMIEYDNKVLSVKLWLKTFIVIFKNLPLTFTFTNKWLMRGLKKYFRNN